MFPLRSLFSANTLSRNVSTFKSALSLSYIYPTSSLSITAPVKIPDNEKFNGFIPIERLDITYSKSSGPGGQHINTTNTKVDIRFHVQSAEWLSEEIKNNISQTYKNKINKDGYLIVRSDKTRSQIYNQADAMTILRELIRKVADAKPPTGPSEETLHALRKRKERANRERLMLKKRHSLIKESRQNNFEL
ncbi:RF-1 domain [Nesidiocoris tenuis]|uniref:Large ribosomal subunit protein mL62 n=1 Tax=Nesidiocoris tenuis TaxID=355587 RepID=A0ABN7B428_9HEMI|nr:RF-1 domain [Nesidiocoris tenuis]